jgi:hypothetical protein
MQINIDFVHVIAWRRCRPPSLNAAQRRQCENDFRLIGVKAPHFCGA